MFETLESRTLMAANYAVLVLQAPTLPNRPVQTDAAVTPDPVPASSLGYGSVLDAQIRTVPGGLYLTIAASSTQIRPEAPTGTVDIYDGVSYLTTVKLGGALRSTISLPVGTHTILLTYKGDANFAASQNAILARIGTATNTPITEAEAANFARNRAGERVRPTRFLSKINYFDAAGLTVSALPQVAAIPTPPSSGTIGANGAPALINLPAQRFALTTFSSKLPSRLR
jgi:hypothetical protein